MPDRAGSRPELVIDRGVNPVSTGPRRTSPVRCYRAPVDRRERASVRLLRTPYLLVVSKFPLRRFKDIFRFLCRPANADKRRITSVARRPYCPFGMKIPQKSIRLCETDADTPLAPGRRLYQTIRTRLLIMDRVFTVREININIISIFISILYYDRRRRCSLQLLVFRIYAVKWVSAAWACADPNFGGRQRCFSGPFLGEISRCVGRETVTYDRTSL